MQRGFTLVELVLVAAIIAVLSAVAIPRYSASLANFRVTAAAQRIASDLRLAQTQARASSTPRRIEFASGTHSYLIAGMGGLDGSASYAVDLAAEPYRCTLKVELGGVEQITFDGYGKPDRGGFIQVSSGGLVRQVLIDVASGATGVQ